MPELRDYIAADQKSWFAEWFGGLDVAAAAKITVNLERLAQGNRSSLKSVGTGVFESRIDFGPGYRVYLGHDGDALIILIGGGTKARQSRDIEQAKLLWAEYKRRKKATRPAPKSRKEPGRK